MEDNWIWKLTGFVGSLDLEVNGIWKLTGFGSLQKWNWKLTEWECDFEVTWMWNVEVNMISKKKK